MRSLLCILITLFFSCGGETPTFVPADVVGNDTSIAEDIPLSEDVDAPEDINVGEDVPSSEDTVAPEDTETPEDAVTPEDTGTSLDSNPGSPVCDFQCSMMVPVSLECGDGPESIEQCLAMCTDWEATCPAEFTAAFECVGDGGYVCQDGNDLMSANNCNDVSNALNQCLMPQGDMCDSYCTSMVSAAQGCAEGPQTQEECINECGAMKSACPIELDNYFLCVGEQGFVCEEGTTFKPANGCTQEGIDLDNCPPAE
jgi:hypothetical protein